MKTQLLILASLIISLTSCSKSGDSTVSESFLEPKVSLSNVWLNLIEDSSVNKNVSEMDSHKGDKYKIVTPPKHGVVTMNDKGEFTYVPELNFVGSDEFTYEVMINKKMMTNVVKLQVNAINDAPQVLELPVSLEVEEDHVLTGNIWSLDYDSLSLNYMTVAQPAHGTLTVLPLGSFIYTPDANFHGPDTFQVKVSDGTNESSAVTYLINVKSVNDIPVASSLGFAVDAGQTYSGQLVATDIDLNSLTYTLVTSPVKGVATINSATGQLSYSANIGTSGVDTFTYKVNDGTSDSVVKTVTANINAVNVAPVVLPFVHTVIEDQVLTSTLSVSDINGDETVVEITELPTNGVLVVNPDLSYTYTPNKDYTGVDAFSYRANDGQLDSQVAIISITVTPENDAPVTEDVILSQSEDTPLTGTLIGSDVDGDSLTFSALTQPAHGSLTLNADGTFVYTPNLNYHGQDSFTYRASDSVLNSAVSTVSITVTPVNDASVMAGISFSTPEETTYTGNLVATDVDGDSLTYSLLSSPSKGSVIINPNGSFSYTPNLNENGLDSFTFKVNDGSGEIIVGASVTIMSTNDLPTTTNSSISTNEDTLFNGSLLASDIDGNSLTYTIVSQGSKGSVSVNPTTGSFSYTPSLNQNGSDSFSFRVNDGSGDSNISTVSVTIVPVNDAPVANTQTISVNRNQPRSLTVTGSDVEGSSLNFSLVTSPTKGVISGTFPNIIYTPNTNEIGADSFSFKSNDGQLDSEPALVTVNIVNSNQLPVTANDSKTTNEDTVLSSSVTGTDGDMDALTFSVVTQGTKGSVVMNANGTYTYTPNLNANGPDSFTYKANDSFGDSNVSTVSITITPVNDAPVSSNGTLSLNEDSVGSGSLAASDVDGDSLNYFVVDQPSKGTVTLNPTTGAYIYSPSANSNGADSFTFKVNDGTVDSNISTVSITVNQENDLPITSGGSLTFNEDTVGSGSLIASDMDGDSLTYALVTPPTKGTVTLNPTTGSYTFTPTLNANGPDSFTFRVNDGSGNSNTSTVTVTITPVNDAPVSSNSVLTLNEDSFSGSGTLISSDVDGNPLTYSVETQPTKGTVSVNPSTGGYIYTPNFNSNGSDSFTFKSNDGTVDSNVATVTITITPVNDAPVSNSGTLALLEDTVGSGTVTASDLDGDSVTYSVVSQGSKGTVVINPTTGSYTYTPNLNANGSDSFTFKSNDGTVDSNTATVSVTITPVNDAPVSSNGTLAVNEDTNADSTLISVDVDGDTLTYSIVAQPTKGTVNLNPATGFYTYTPNLNANGADTFTFKSNDGTVDSNTATVSVTISLVNDAPLATNGSSSVNEDSVLNSNVSGSDLDGDTLTYSVVSNPANGTVTLNSNGTFTYTPNANFNGADSFTFRANDGTSNSNTATQGITVTPVNDAPVSSNGTLAVVEDTATNGTLVASDIDGNTLTYSVVSQGTKGTVVITNPTTGAYTYTPSLNSTGADSFTFRVNDGTVNSNTATVSVTISTVNDAPLANNSSFTVLEDSGISARSLSGSDPESSPITYVLVTSPTKGVISGFNSSTGAYSYTPNANANGPDSFTFKTNDGTLDSSNATVSITITPVNDAPVWTSPTSITLNTLMNTPVSTTLSATDIDGNAITYTLQACSGGTCNLNSTTGAFTFTPNNGYTGTVGFGATCTDGTVYCSPNTFITINITSPNTAPLATNSSNKLLVRNGSVDVTLTATDAQGDSLTYSIVSSPTGGTLSGTGNTRTYTLGAGTVCGNEGDSCTNSGTSIIKYGTSTKYIVTKVTGNFICSNETFGDPIVGAGKSCTILPSTDSFTFRANDGSLNSNVATVTINLEDWWNQSWTKRRKLVFNGQNSGDLTDAPVLVKLDSSRIDYSQVQAGGTDLRFVDEAGDLLSYEIESWNPAGVSYVWLKTTIGGMESQTHHVWMYYGNPIAGNGQNVADVWSNGYVSVWHFNQTSGDVIDSKGVNHGSAYNLTRTYAGPLGNAYSNTNNDACVEIAHHSSQAITETFTVEALARSTTTTGFSDILQKDIYSGGNWYWAYSLEFNAGRIGTTITNTSLGSTSYYTSASHYTQNTWKYQALTFRDSTNTMRAYSNGVMVEQNTSASRSMYSGSAWNSLSLMGDCASAGYRGQADEVRLSNVERSAEWIKFQQLSMTDGVIMYGQEQDVSSPLLGLAYNLRIESGVNDGNILVGTGMWGVSGETGNGVNWIGEENNQDSFGYYRFQLLNDIPSFGVTNAKLKLMGVDSSNAGLWNSSSHYLRVSMQQTGNAPQVSAFNQYPGGAGGVTDSATKVSWNASSLNWNGSGWNESPNLSSVINNVRSSFSLPRSNYIQLWVKRGASFNCGSSSFCQAGSADSAYQSGMLAPQLLIEY